MVANRWGRFRGMVGAGSGADGEGYVVGGAGSGLNGAGSDMAPDV